MTRRLGRCTWALLTSALMLVGTSGDAAAQTISVPGTGASYVLLGHLAEAYNRKVGSAAIEVPPSTGSTAAYLAVRERRTVLARVDRAPREGESRIGMQYVVFARDAVVFAVGEAVTVTSLSAERIAAALSGKVARWRELGGPDLPVRVLLREPRKTSWVTLKRAFPQLEAVTANNGAKLASNDYEMVELLDKYRSGIGYTTRSSLGGARSGVRVLEVEGTAATPAAMRAGKYRAMTEFGVVYRADNLPKPARDFVDFLFSPEAQRIMTEQGVLPVPRS